MGELDLHVGAGDVLIRDAQLGLRFLLRGRHHQRHVGRSGSDKPTGQRLVRGPPDARDLHEPGDVAAEVPGLGERTVDTGRTDLENVGRLAQRIACVQTGADDPGGLGHLIQGERIDHAGLVARLESGQITIKPDADQTAPARWRHCHVLNSEAKLPDGARSLPGALEVTQNLANSFLNAQCRLRSLFLNAAAPRARSRGGRRPKSIGRCTGHGAKLHRVCLQGQWWTSRQALRPGDDDGAMIPLTAPLPDAQLWLGRGLEILLIILGATLLTRFATWFKAIITERIDANDLESDALVRSEAAKHRHALAQVLSWTALVVVYCIAGMQIAERLGVPTSSLVAPAAVVGVALGFGAQRLVQDLLAGFFIIAERQYGFGDLISIAGPGIPSGVIGTVEDVTLRITKVRTANGEVIFTPNGQIAQLTNLSRDWARVVVDVPIPLSVDIGHISEILRQVGRDAYADETLHPQLLDAPAVMGVQSIEVDQIHVRIVARTLPGRQFLVGLTLRGRIAAALRREGIRVPIELDTAEATATTS